MGDERFCAIHAVMLQAEKRMREYLASQSLAEIAGRMAAKAPRTFGPQVVKWFGERGANRRREKGKVSSA
jgi:DNA-binding IscR family transcriptional regulator